MEYTFDTPEGVWDYLKNWIRRDTDFPADIENNALWEERDFCIRIAENERLRKAFDTMTINDLKCYMTRALCGK